MKKNLKKLSAILVVMAMLCSISIVASAAVVTEVAELYGVGQTSGFDGMTQAVTLDGRAAYTSIITDAGKATSQYYGFANETIRSTSNITVEVDYYDNGNEGQIVHFWYVDNTGTLKTTAGITFVMTAQAGWKTRVITLTDAGFAGASTVAGNSAIRFIPDRNHITFAIGRVQAWTTETYGMVERPDTEGMPAISGMNDGSKIQITSSDVSWTGDKTLCTVTLGYEIDGAVTSGSYMPVMGYVFRGSEVAENPESVEIVKGDIRAVTQTTAASSGTVTFNMIGDGRTDVDKTVSEDDLLVVKMGTTGVATVPQAFYVKLADGSHYPDHYTVTFDGNGGTGSMISQSVAVGDNFTLPSCGFTAPSGMAFDGWEINGYKYNVGDNYVMSGDITISALWKDVNYTITFAANGGAGTMANDSVAAGTNYTLPSCGFTAPAACVFNGWKVGNTTYQAGDTIKITGDTTITAQWKNTNTTKYLKGIIEMPAGGVKVGDTVSITYKFAGQSGEKVRSLTFEIPYDNTKLSIADAGVGFVPASITDTLIKALYVDTTGKGISVAEENDVFKLNVTLLSGATADDLNALVPSVVYYQVPGNATKYTDVDITMEVESSYQISFVANGGSGSMDSMSAKSGEKVTLPACTFGAPSGMAFAGWQVGAVVYHPGTVIEISDNTTVTAIWKSVPATKTLTAEINAPDGASAGDTATITYKFAAKSSAKLSTLTFEVPYDNTKFDISDQGEGFVPINITGSLIKAFMFNSGGTNVGSEQVAAVFNVTLKGDATEDDLYKLIPPVVYYKVSGQATNFTDVEVLAIEAPAANVIYGDVDGDEVVGVYDVLTLIDHYLELAVITEPERLLASDVDGDGTVGVYDVLILIDYYLELITEFPAAQ